MKRKPKIQIEYDVPVPEFAVNRVGDFLSEWMPTVQSLRELATSLYLQGIADGWTAGEEWMKRTGREL